MFEKTFCNVSVKTVNAEKRGLCLEAKNTQGERILMDFCGMNPALVPDGTNAYLFGNIVIFVTRWSDMTDSEKETVETGELGLVIHPYEYVQFSLKVGRNWGDVTVNLYHCYDGLNDENAPVKGALFIFADTHDSDYIVSRTVAFPPFVQKYLQKSNVNSHKGLALDAYRGRIENAAKADRQKDYCDVLYDVIWSDTKETARKARKAEPDNVPDGIYIDIDSDNTITDIRQHECEPEVPPMSSEVQLYYKVAMEGFAEGQYNLGVCYETGDGIAQDHKQAVYWYKKAADQGHAKAQHNLGVCLYNGYGVQANHEEAAKYFLLSAEQGDMYAQYNMGVCCYMGVGVEKDIFKAVNWFQKAAEQGHPEAKRILSGG